jgi:hypothetical protein
MCRCIKLTSLNDALLNIGIPDNGQLFCIQIEEKGWHEFGGLVLGYNQNVLIDRIFIKLQIGLLYNLEPFHYPTSGECLELHYKFEDTDANQGSMPESHTIWIRYTESDLDTTFHSRVPSLSVSYFSWTPPNQILEF